MVKNINIKDSNICSFFNEVDDIPHFLLKCEKLKNYGYFSFIGRKWISLIMDIIKMDIIINEYH